MALDLNTLVTLIFGAGATGAIGGIISVVKTLRGGKIENEETLIRRLDTDNKNQQRRAEAAEEAQREAEKEADEYRKERNRAREQLARIRWYVMRKYGDELNEFGDEND